VKQIKNGRQALRVQRETLRNLSASNLRRVGGGDDYVVFSATNCCDQFPYNFLPPGTRSQDPPDNCTAFDTGFVDPFMSMVC
jgi:hypothetical protein